MKLTQGELIAVFRWRKGWTQKQMGEELFPKLNAPHVKMRKLEAGIQKPTPKEVEAIALKLGVKVSDLTPKDNKSLEGENDAGFLVNKEALNKYPQLRHYLQMLNTAAKIEDADFSELTIRQMGDYLSKKSKS